MEKESLSAEIQMKVRRKAFLSCICKLEFTLLRTEQTGIFILSHHKHRSPLTQLTQRSSHTKKRKGNFGGLFMNAEVLRKCIFKTRGFDRKLFRTLFPLHEKDRGSLGKAVNIGPQFWFSHTYSTVLKSPVVALKNFTLQQ